MNELILFTKSYPFGHKETYVHNEIPFLLNQFDRICIIPIDYYGDGSDINYSIDEERISFFLVNSVAAKKSLFYTLQKNFRCGIIVLSEIISGRDGWNHLRHFRFAHTYAKICYDQAKAIEETVTHRNRSQIIYSYWFHKSVVVAALMKRFFGVRLPLISRAHSSDLYHRDWNQFMQLEKEPFMPLEWYKVKWTDKIFTISDHGCLHFKKVFPKYSNKFEVSRLAVKATSKLNPFKDEGIFRMVTCSGITRNKRVIRMPAIVDALRDYPVEWVHIGSSWKENVQLLVDEITQRGISDKVVLKGQMTQEEIKSYYESEQINLFLNISRAEGLPVSIMEAFSFGVPAIATSAVGSPEIVDDSCGGVIPVEFEDADLVEMIKQLILSPESQRIKRAGALSRFNADYSAEKNYSLFAKLLLEFMHSQTAIPPQ